jgi:aldose 1-epimerase
MEFVASDTRPLPASSLGGKEWTIEADGHQAVVVEVGGGLRAYRADGVDIVQGYAEDEMAVGGAGQILAPWPNRIRDGRYTFGDEAYQLSLTEPLHHNAIHGLVNWAGWRLVDEQPGSVTLELTMPAQPGYPWPLLFRTRWQVGAGGLRVHHEVTNIGFAPCPFGFSVHPYLRFPDVSVDDLVLGVPARSRLLLDSRLLPIGAAKVVGTDYDFTTPRRIGSAVLDTTFVDLERESDGGSAVTLATPDGGRSTRIWADEHFGWWQVFSSDTLPGDRFRAAVAIEPMTCPPDAFRSGRGIIVLEPAQTWTATWGITPS